MAKAQYETYETFNLHVPTSCAGVPSELLNPRKSWTGKADFKEEVSKLGGLFVENFKKYADEATPEVIRAGECEDKYRHDRFNIDVGPETLTNEPETPTDVLASSEAPISSAQAPASIQASEPTLNGNTPGEDPKVPTTSTEILVKEPGCLSNGAEVPSEEGEFSKTNGVHDVISEVETKAKPIRDSGIGFVNGEDSTGKF